MVESDPGDSVSFIFLKGELWEKNYLYTVFDLFADKQAEYYK